MYFSRPKHIMSGYLTHHTRSYFTHGSWSILFFIQLLILRVQKRHLPLSTFLSDHYAHIRETALMVKHQNPHAHITHATDSPWSYIASRIAGLTCALTVAGGSWYVAVDLTTASDLTAIYNCSAFFAYVFSVPLLGEKVRTAKVLAVAVAVGGVFIVAYGDSFSTEDPNQHLPGGEDQDDAPSRGLGNLIIGVGSILYGLYEVLYKRLGCPPDGTSPGRSMLFANFIGTCIGLFTLSVLWIPLPILNYFGWEVWALPTGAAARMLAISVLANAVFSGSFLVLISLTSPVLSSVAALLTIFLVAIVDQILPPPMRHRLSAAAVVGGAVIVVAFGLLTWSTYREMEEERREKAERGLGEESDEEEEMVSA
jgi:drug/metabolite transporter (DMT)-like permease